MFSCAILPVTYLVLLLCFLDIMQENNIISNQIYNNMSNQIIGKFDLSIYGNFIEQYELYWKKYFFFSLIKYKCIVDFLKDFKVHYITNVHIIQ